MRAAVSVATTAFCCLALVAASAFAADYDKTEQTPLYTLHLKAPAVAMAIPPLKDQILALYQSDAEETKKQAQEDKDGNPEFHPYQVDTVWRVTFDSAAVLSLSGETFADTGGAHPNGAFQTLVWDKQANRIVPIEALFAPEQAKAALAAIGDAAAKAWVKTYTQRSGDKPDADLPGDAIGPEPDKLKNYALTYAKGQTNANGIVLLYGAGQAWPHVLGDFRLSVPAGVFAKFLAPQWKAVFVPG
jgi:hypothetical protein